MKCKKCGYEWETKSNLLLVSCPSCGDKNKVNKDEGIENSMENKTTLNFTYYGRLLKKCQIKGFKKGEVESIKSELSKKENVPKDEIDIEVD